MHKLLAAERDARLAWLTISPSTMAGVIATFEHASSRNDGDCAYLAETAEYIRGDGDPNDVVAAGEAFPPMIPTAVRELVQPLASL